MDYLYYRNQISSEINAAKTLLPFQKNLLANSSKDVIIGKQRNQRVTTTLAYCAIKQARRGKYVAAFMTNDQYRIFFERVMDCLSESKISAYPQNQRLLFEKGGSIFLESRNEKHRRIDTGIFDEVNFSKKPIAGMQKCQNVLASITIRESTAFQDKVLRRNINRLFVLLAKFPNAKYIEAGDFTMFSRADIRKFRSML